MDRLITDTRDVLERELADSVKKEVRTALTRAPFDQELAARAYAGKS
jgi:hypothetical protein